MSVEIRPVVTRRDRREFIELPYRLHATSPQWIPPLRIERRLFLNPRFNAFFKHGEAQLFLAWRDGRVVGRISAHLDRHFYEFHDNAWGMFGFFEVEEDAEAAQALLDAAAAWNTAPTCERPDSPWVMSAVVQSPALIAAAA